jgi:hypothetical protein
MGTRGVVGFHRGGEDKIMYNHFDSYPECLGRDTINFIRETSIEEMNEIFERIIMVEMSSVPNTEQIEECEKYYDSRVSTGEKLNGMHCYVKLKVI